MSFLAACLRLRDRVRTVSVSAGRFSLSLSIFPVVSLNAPNQRLVTCGTLGPVSAIGTKLLVVVV